MAASYQQLKDATIKLLDDRTVLNIQANYTPAGKKIYDADTKLEDIGLTLPILLTLYKPMNDTMGKLCGGGWHKVGPDDTTQQDTIGDMTTLVCGQSNTVIPPGEPT